MRGPFSTPITPLTGSLLHADPQLKRLTAAVKRVLTRFVTNIAPSKFLSTNFPRPVVILNTYDERLFRWPDDGARRSGVIFVGRLEEWKGCRTLVEAFALVADEWPDLRLTIVGHGPDLPTLKRMAADFNVEARVDFAGVLRGEELARTLARHQVMVVPSIGAEPFGIVALEGLAAGCRLIVSNVGGLPEAVGPHAPMFTPGNAQELAALLRQVLSEPDGPERRAAVERHLESYAPAVIAEQYLAVFRAMAS
jgi:glycogen synthase